MHGAILIVGVLLALPVAIADVLLLSPTPGGFISLDFRGLLIGAYGVLWLVESLLATLGVAILRGRSAIGTIGAHAAAFAVLAGGAAAWWMVIEWQDHRALDELNRLEEAAWADARDDLAVVRWSRVGDGARVTIRANEPGELGVEYARRPDAYVSPYPEHAIAAGREITLDLEVDDYASGGDGDYFFVAWATDAFRIPFRFCRPACQREPGDDDPVLIALPPPAAP